ncbi:MAG: tryptophan synthase subunit alpha [Spirochaeta sp.]|jgi:tryptophan synthase alpha chain|nr:tryptophan synthase subunit alpha [Spirochaeta sp.]
MAPNAPMPPNTLMTHMIPFFPDRDTSFSVARAMIDGGTTYLEVQFPFSDPTADGPTIQGASARALDAGFRLAAGWKFVSEILSYAASVESSVEVFVMSYASPVFARGVDAFVATAAEVGVAGLIVPDLPIDSDEGLYAAGRRHGVEIVPVIALGASPARVELTRAAGTRYIYASLRRGTTGAYTEIGEENIAFLQSLATDHARVVAGFGISSVEQVTAVLRYADAVVIGSAFVREVESAVAAGRSVYDAIRQRTATLAGVSGG